MNALEHSMSNTRSSMWCRFNTSPFRYVLSIWIPPFSFLPHDFMAHERTNGPDIGTRHRCAYHGGIWHLLTRRHAAWQRLGAGKCSHRRGTWEGESGAIDIPGAACPLLFVTVISRNICLVVYKIPCSLHVYPITYLKPINIRVTYAGSTAVYWVRRLSSEARCLSLVANQ